MIGSRAGDRFKILRDTTVKDMIMTLHFSIKEAAILIMHSKAGLRLTEKNFILRQTMHNNAGPGASLIPDKKRLQGQCYYGA